MKQLVRRLKALNPNGSVSVHELLGGRVDDGRNNILKSPQLADISDGIAHFISEPYNEAFKINNIDNSWESYDRLERTMNRRKKAIFEVLGDQVERIDVVVYDHWEMLGSFSVGRDDLQ